MVSDEYSSGAETDEPDTVTDQSGEQSNESVTADQDTAGNNVPDEDISEENVPESSESVVSNEYSTGDEAADLFPIRNQAGLFEIGFSRLAGNNLLRFSYENASLTMAPLSPAPVAGSIDRNSISYREIYPDTDLKYTVKPNFLKEELTVKKYTGVTDFDFQFSVTNAVYNTTPNSDIVFCDPTSGRSLFYMPRPFAVDSNGNCCDLDLELTKDGIRVSIDPDWLRKAAYPVVIDPAIYLFDATFSRLTAAYTPDGAQVDSDSPRYEPARFNQGILIEEWTTNLLTPNQSSVETDLTGFTSLDELTPINRDTTTAWNGSASVKVTNGCSWYQICYIDLGNVSVSPGETYSFSAYCKASSAVDAYMEIDFLDNSYSYLDYYSGSPVAASTTWQRAEVTATAPDNAAYIHMQLLFYQLPGSSSGWGDGFQLELKSHPTSWTPGGKNLLTENQSSVETDLTGLFLTSNYGSVTFSRDSTVAWTGSASAKITNNYTSSQTCIVKTDNGFYYTDPLTPAIAGKVYTVSAWMKTNASANGDIQINFWDSSGKLIYVFGTTSISVNSTWRRFAYTVTAPANSAYISIMCLFTILPAGASGWLDGLQIEQNTSATPWTLGGTTRNQESLKIPTPNVLSPNQGTIEEWAYIDPSGVHSSSNPNYTVPFSVVTMEVSSERNQISIRRLPSSTSWQIAFSNSSGSLGTISLGSITTPGWYCFGVKWQQGVGGYGYLNGDLKGSVSATYLPSAFNSTAYIGSSTTNRQLSSIIDDLRISSIARDDSDILAAYQSNQPLPVDSSTTCKLNFDGNAGVYAIMPSTGVEAYWNYAGIDLGGGWSASVNTWNQNLIINKPLFSIPGRGMAIGEDITYNSLTKPGPSATAPAW